MRRTERLRLAFCFAFGATCLVASPRAQNGDELDLILNRLATYLLKYEDELSTVVAEERYDQRILREARYADDQVRIGPSRALTRNLESDVAFLRLPGGEAWFGHAGTVRGGASRRRARVAFATCLQSRIGAGFPGRYEAPQILVSGPIAIPALGDDRDGTFHTAQA